MKCACLVEREPTKHPFRSPKLLRCWWQGLIVTDGGWKNITEHHPDITLKPPKHRWSNRCGPSCLILHMEARLFRLSQLVARSAFGLRYEPKAGQRLNSGDKGSCDCHRCIPLAICFCVFYRGWAKSCTKMQKMQPIEAMHRRRAAFAAPKAHARSQPPTI